MTIAQYWDIIKTILRNADPEDPRVVEGYMFYYLNHRLLSIGEKEITKEKFESLLESPLIKPKISRKDGTITFYGMQPKGKPEVSQIIAQILSGEKSIAELERSPEVKETGSRVMNGLIARSIDYGIAGKNSIAAFHTINKETGKETILILFPQYDEEKGVQILIPAAEILMGGVETLQTRYVAPAGGWSYVPV